MYHNNNQQEALIRAVLGPTNTGKTWLAFDRMLSFRSGIMGFPLRLLARENYDKAVKIKGIQNVALITGEEKILPPKAQYFFCTTESMPTNKEVDFLAVDEIQLCADPDRGHIFTDRLLHARGRYETMFMGAQLIEPFIKALVPKITIETRDRLSVLSWAGRKSIERLPPRCAIVSFSASDVYATAELVRRQRGGAAVVLGALSPRTRNAQVAMYQAGEVDWLIATDAIGMGLNMDINHVAFAATKKFDGHKLRSLTAQELAQIAGRAGRGGNDGTFGTTGGIAKLDDLVIESIENHEFSPPKQIFWRNSNLQFTSTAHLISSLKQAPPKSFLIRPRNAEDEAVLQILSQDNDVMMRVNTPDGVRALWEAARIPDYSKTHVGAHAQMLKPLLLNILDTGHISTSWMQQQFNRLDKEDSNLERLIQQIAAVRTLTYIAYQKHWLGGAAHWQAQTRALEDRLSDKLHESLTKRFVDRKNAVLMSRLKQHSQLYAVVHNNGDVDIEGHHFGKLEGFVFHAHTGQKLNENFSEKAIQSAVNQALRLSLNTRVQQFLSANSLEITLQDNQLFWNNQPIAHLQKGDDIYRPIVRLIPASLLDERQQMQIMQKLQQWLDQQINKNFKLNIRLERYCYQHNHLRSLGYNLHQYLGVTFRQYTGSVSFEQRDVQHLSTRFYLYFGRVAIYNRKYLKGEPMAWRKLLVQLYFALPSITEKFQDTMIKKPIWDNNIALYMGYIALSDFWVRVDYLEKLIKKSNKKDALQLKNVAKSLNLEEQQAHKIMKQLGFIRKYNKKEDIAYYSWSHRIKGHINREKKQNHNPDNPFSVLQELELKPSKKQKQPKSGKRHGKS